MIGPTPESCLQGLSRQTPFPYHLVNWLSRQREVTDIYMKSNTVIEYKTVAANIYDWRSLEQKLYEIDESKINCYRKTQ